LAEVVDSGWSFAFGCYQQAQLKHVRLIAVEDNREALLTLQKNHGGTFWESLFNDVSQQDDLQ